MYAKFQAARFYGFGVMEETHTLTQTRTLPIGADYDIMGHVVWQPCWKNFGPPSLRPHQGEN